MKVTVVGLGKIGLPLAVQIAGRGHDVCGHDIAAEVVNGIQQGTPSFPGESELDERLRAVLEAERFHVTTDAGRATRDADVVIIVVPLIVDSAGTPDFTAIDAATAAVAPHLKRGSLVSYETTLPVGTTRNRFTHALEAGCGRSAGSGLFVCHSPERVSSGTVFRDLGRYPKLVGGVDPVSAARAVECYSSFLEFDERSDLSRPNGVWDLGSAEAAELAKLAETTYRDINIAFANELALAADIHGLDVQGVIEACNSQPYSHIHQPGIAVGGHCIPVYPHFLMAGSPGARLPVVAREINRGMPEHAVRRLADALGGSLVGSRVVVFGLAYRPGVKEHAFSGAMDLVRLLQERGARVAVDDPLYEDAEIESLALEPHRPGGRADAWILHTAHPEYRSLLDRPDTPRVVFDGRGVLDPSGLPGVRVLSFGRRADDAPEVAR